MLYAENQPSQQHAAVCLSHGTDESRCFRCLQRFPNVIWSLARVCICVWPFFSQPSIVMPCVLSCAVCVCALCGCGMRHFVGNQPLLLYLFIYCFIYLSVVWIFRRISGVIFCSCHRVARIEWINKYNNQNCYLWPRFTRLAYSSQIPWWHSKMTQHIYRAVIMVSMQFIRWY